MRKQLYIGGIIFGLACIGNMCLAQAKLKEKRDSSVVSGLLQEAEAYFTDSNYDSAFAFCDRAEAYSIRNNYRKGLAYTYIKKTEIYIDREELNTAGGYPPKVLAIAAESNDSLLTAIAWMQQGQIAMYGDKLDEATTWIGRALQYYLSTHPSTYSALAFNDLGYAWGAKGEYSKEANCIIQAISIYEKYFPEEYGELAVSLNNLSTVYNNLKDIDKAIEYGKRSLFYREKDGDVEMLSIGCCNMSQLYCGRDSVEALRYLQLCVKYAEQSKQPRRVVHSYITASRVLTYNGRPDRGLEYEYRAINLLEKAKIDPVMLGYRYLAVAVLQRQLKEDTATVLASFRKAEAALLPLKSKTHLRDYYRELATYLRETGNYRDAYDSYKKFISYRDSLVNENTESAIAEITTRYETEKKDNEISRLTTDRRIKELQIEKQNALLAGNILEAQKKENEIELLSKAREVQALKIRQQDEELEKQLLLARNNEQQLKLTAQEKQLKEKQLRNSRLITNFTIGAAIALALLAYFMFSRYQLRRKVREQEALLTVRNNIAKELHDEIGSTLTSIRILSQVSEKNLHKDHEKTSSFLQKIKEQSAAVQQGISDIVWAVKPENDRLGNLVIRMREYIAHTLESAGIQSILRIDEQVLEDTLTMNQRKDFFLVFKEAVNNVAKYASATEVQVHLERLGSFLQLQIVDNGKGFDEAVQTSSSGLKNMRERAAALGGSLHIRTAKGEGTAVTLRMPAT